MSMNRCLKSDLDLLSQPRHNLTVLTAVVHMHEDFSHPGNSHLNGRHNTLDQKVFEITLGHANQVQPTGFRRE
ncbi:hypothetical protein D3C80_1647980 [compost metagenome]